MPTPEFGIVPPDRVRADVRRLLERAPTFESIYEVLRLLAKHRSHMIQWDLVSQCGSKVFGGPFAGMDFIDRSSEGCHVPKLLGCYENELHPFIEAAIEAGYDEVVNIGCAEGYYACGFALRMPSARVYAFDIDPKARDMVAAVCERNGVAERVTVGETFSTESFARFAGRRALFLIDIEGNEAGLVSDAQALRGFDLIIECHDAPGKPISAELQARLDATHATRLVANSSGSITLPPMIRSLGHLDQLLAVWEWRERLTPWLVAAARQTTDSPLARLL